MKSESVNHPSHYNMGGVEVIDAVEAWGFGEGFNRGNAIKYIARAGRKDQKAEIEDLEKAKWYIQREIERVTLEQMNDSCSPDYCEIDPQEEVDRMLDRKKVIEGLEFTLVESGWDADRAYDEQLMIEAVTDAIALLKAQETRVMTLEEIASQEGPVWLEYRYRDGRWAFFDKGFRRSYGINISLWTFLEVIPEIETKEYNITWRCWTSRPTDEQREAVKWDG